MFNFYKKNTSKQSSCINVVIIRTSSIGDLVLSTACLNLLQQLKANYSLNFNVTWIGSAPSLEFIRSYYPEVNCIDIKKTGFIKTLIKTLTHKKPHIVLNLQNNIRAWSFSFILSTLSFIKISTYDKRGKARDLLIEEALRRSRSKDLGPNDIDPSFKLFLSMASSLFKAIENVLKKRKIDTDIAFDLKTIHPCLDTKKLRLKEEDKTILSGVNPYRYNLVISRGGSFNPKKAPLSLLEKIFTELRSEISSTYLDKLNLVFIGSTGDKKYNDELIDKLKSISGFSIMDFTAKLSLIQTSLLLSRSNLLLGNDSLHFHLMEAVGGKSIGLWGPTFENFGFSCWNKGSRIFSSPVGCRPCSKHGQTPCRFNDYKCFELIDPKSVSSFIAQDIVRFFEEKWTD